VGTKPNLPRNRDMTKSKDYPQSYADVEDAIEEAISEHTVEILNEARKRAHLGQEDQSQLIVVTLVAEDGSSSAITSSVEYGDGEAVGRAIMLAHEIRECMLAPEESVEVRCHDIDMQGAIKDSYVVEVDVIREEPSNVN
jgi:hypothetical protein